MWSFDIVKKRREADMTVAQAVRVEASTNGNL